MDRLKLQEWMDYGQSENQIRGKEKRERERESKEDRKHNTKKYQIILVSIELVYIVEKEVENSSF